VSAAILFYVYYPFVNLYTINELSEETAAILLASSFLLSAVAFHFAARYLRRSTPAERRPMPTAFAVVAILIATAEAVAAGSGLAVTLIILALGTAMAKYGSY